MAQTIIKCKLFRDGNLQGDVDVVLEDAQDGKRIGHFAQGGPSVEKWTHEPGRMPGPKREYVLETQSGKRVRITAEPISDIIHFTSEAADWE